MSDTNGTADLVFVNGPVYTVDASRSWAGAVAVRSGTIVAVGTDDDVRAWMGAHTEIVDLAGRMLLPGFQDAHIHPPVSGLEMLRCNLSEIYSLEEYQRIIADYAAANPDAPWILGGGWYMDVFPGGTPTKDVLDAIVPDRPAMPDQSRRTRRLGQLACAGPRRDHAGHAGSGRRPHRANARRRTVRHPPRGSDALGRRHRAAGHRRGLRRGTAGGADVPALAGHHRLAGRDRGHRRQLPDVGHVRAGGRAR